MKVFLDTNVLVAAFATRGLCADVLRAVLASHQLVVCAPLLAELRRVLKQKIRLPDHVITEIVELLKRDAQDSSPADLPRVRIRDKSDVVLLASALSGQAEFFVTGDQELLELGKVETLEIISPREFWEKIRAAKPEKK